MATAADNLIDSNSITSDESFDAPTQAPPTLVGDQPARDIDELEAGASQVRDQFRKDLISQAEADDSAEQRNAKLLELGWRNALEWLENKSHLRAALTSRNLNMGKDDYSLMTGIAQLQLGDWKENAKGIAVWTVPRRRHDRQGQFYRIFLGDRERWNPDGLADTLLAQKGKTTGVLKAAAIKKVKVGKKELAENLKAADKATPIAKAPAPNLKLGKSGAYRIVIARVTSGGLDIHKVVDYEALTSRLVDDWAAEVAAGTSTEKLD